MKEFVIEGMEFLAKASFFIVLGAVMLVSGVATHSWIFGLLIGAPLGMASAIAVSGVLFILLSMHANLADINYHLSRLRQIERDMANTVLEHPAGDGPNRDGQRKSDYI